MIFLNNPVFLSVLTLCVLCLCKLNVLISLIIAALIGALSAGMNFTTAMDILTQGFSHNAGTSLSYILLGTFATTIATTGLANIMSNKISKIMKYPISIILLILAGIACLSQNLIPIHIAFIPILIPPLLVIMNKLQIDRRAIACSLAFGLKAPYIAIPFGFGTIFMGLIAENMTSNGMFMTLSDVTKYNWILALSMFIGLLIAIFCTYKNKRKYEDKEISIETNVKNSDKLSYPHLITLIAIIVVVIVQLLSGSLPLASLSGLLIMFIFRGIKWKDIDAQFIGGINLMGMIAMIMLVAGGYAEVIKATGAVNELVKETVSIMQGSKLIAACSITLIGLLVTMGIGSSFSTIPVLAVIYVPICSEIGFSPAATLLLLSSAAALGDAGSPSSDTTLGPTAGLNADGQHDHIWDTCIPTFIHFNIPLALSAIIISQFI